MSDIREELVNEMIDQIERSYDAVVENGGESPQLRINPELYFMFFRWATRTMPSFIINDMSHDSRGQIKPISWIHRRLGIPIQLHIDPLVNGIMAVSEMERENAKG